MTSVIVRSIKVGECYFVRSSEKEFWMIRTDEENVVEVWMKRMSEVKAKNIGLRLLPHSIIESEGLVLADLDGRPLSGFIVKELKRSSILDIPCGNVEM